MPTSSEKLAKLKAQQEKLKARIALEQNRIAAQERKNDTRRKIIAGALALTHAQMHPTSDFANTLNALIARHVDKKTDRALFDLAPLPENKNQHADTNNPTA